MKEGDRNTSFFHRMTNSHIRGNHITRMKINDVWVTEEAEMRQGIMEAFKTLLLDTWEWRASIDGLSFQRISEEEVASLEIPFIVEEVSTYLGNLNGDKALGPDGFTFAFWQLSWEFVKDAIMRMFKDFFEIGKFVKNLNTTFLVLMPKMGGLRTSRTLGL